MRRSPGPWKVEQGYPLSIVDVENESIICTLDGGKLISDADNARLIAAAPDMLEFLKGFAQEYCYKCNAGHGCRACNRMAQ